MSGQFVPGRIGPRRPRMSTTGGFSRVPNRDFWTALGSSKVPYSGKAGINARGIRIDLDSKLGKRGRVVLSKYRSDIAIRMTEVSLIVPTQLASSEKLGTEPTMPHNPGPVHFQKSRHIPLPSALHMVALDPHPHPLQVSCPG